MYISCDQAQAKEKVRQALAEDSASPISQMSEQLGLNEGEITFVLPEEMVGRAEGQHAQAILEQLPEWGKVTTIVHSFGSIFEAKARFPKGKVAHGYYNLMGKEGELHGHLKLDLVKHIGFVSKPFRSMESHYIGFFTEQGDCVFKVYLGRDKKRQLIPEQIEEFKKMRKEYSK